VSVAAIPRLEHTGRVTQLRVGRSEWTKLWTVRSTKWTLGVATLLLVGLPCLVATIMASHWNSMTPQEQANHNPLDVLGAGVGSAQLAIAVLGVLVITAEYSTGMIRASFTAVPKRLPVLWAKIGVFGLTTVALSAPAVLIAYWATKAIFHSQPTMQVSLSDPGWARTIVGLILYVPLVGIFALGLGAIVRNTAAGISLFAAIFFVIPPLLLLLPSSWRDPVEPYLPGNAAQAIATWHNDSHTLNPGPGAIVLLGYIVLVIGVAAILLRRRDT
jgi:ABC-type transport system involved in multi-copper enzyme maturation permease subunit